MASSPDSHAGRDLPKTASGTSSRSTAPLLQR